LLTNGILNDQILNTVLIMVFALYYCLD